MKKEEKKDKTEKMFEESKENKFGRRDDEDDTTEDVLSDINEKREQFYEDQDMNNRVIHDNRYDSGNR